MKNTTFFCPMSSFYGEFGVLSTEATRSTCMLVYTLSRKIERNPANPDYIVSEPWIGYRFRNPAGVLPRSGAW
jgi:hypothetical protein